MHKKIFIFCSGFLLTSSLQAQQRIQSRQDGTQYFHDEMEVRHGKYSNPVFRRALKPIRLSMGIGLLNAHVKGEFRLGKHQSVSGNFGIGGNCVSLDLLNSDNFNLFNGYGPGAHYGYHNPVSTLSGLEIWAALDAGAEYRYYFITRSKQQFKHYPYNNSGAYAGLGVRFLGRQIKEIPAHNNSIRTYKDDERVLVLPTTKYTLVLGFQKESIAKPVAIDLCTGFGLLVNHNYTATIPTWVLRAMVSITLYSKYKK